MENIGEKLKEIRESKHLSRREVADKLKGYGFDISDKTLYGYEVGRTSANADMFMALCQIYEIEDVLATFDNTGYKADGSLFLNEEETALILKYRMLDERGKLSIDNLMNIEFLSTPDHAELMQVYTKKMLEIKRRMENGKTEETPIG